MNKNSKKSEILNWRVNNPNGTKSECAKELKVSGSTVAKWWDLFEAEACPDKLEPCAECEDATKSNENSEKDEINTTSKVADNDSEILIKENKALQMYAEKLREENEEKSKEISGFDETKKESETILNTNKWLSEEVERLHKDNEENKVPIGYKYATIILAIMCCLLFIGCIQGTRKSQESAVPETKTLSIVADENNKLDYIGNYMWYLDNSGFVYEIVDDKVSIIGQTIASLEVSQEDYDGYIEAIKEQFELIPLENLNGYNIVTGDGLNVVVYDTDKQIAYEIYLATSDEKVVDEIISSLDIVETAPEISETIETPEAE